MLIRLRRKNQTFFKKIYGISKALASKNLWNLKSTGILYTEH